MTPEEVSAALRAELTAVEETLRQHVDSATATKFAETNKSLGDIRGDLQKLMERGEDPSATVVADLEKRLIEQENAFREFTLKAGQLQLSDADRKIASDEALFKGVFINDIPAFRNILSGMRTNGSAAVNSRSIDSSLFSTGGKLSPETADRFIDFMIEKQTALSRVTTRRMANPTGHADVLSVSRRKLRKAVEGIEPDTAESVGITRRTMNTVEMIWAEDVTLTFLEDNIEGRGAESHIARLLATQFGNDSNDLAWNGNESNDSSGSSGFLPINNGWVRLMFLDGNVTDVNAASLVSPSNTTILNTAFRALPIEFKGMPDLVYWVPVPFAERYAEEVSTRETGLGDQVLINGLPVLRYFGTPLVAENHLYEETADNVVLTPASNLYHGIQRQIMIDAEWRPRKRAIEFTITARTDYEYSTGLAIVLVDNVPTANR